MVYISRRVYEEMLNSPLLPPETGGILGCQAGVITKCYRDLGVNNGKIGSYTPNTWALNSKILEWNRKNVLFCGIYHTHYGGDTKLSKGDINYIRHILNQQCSICDGMLFPLVFPCREVIFYKAKIIENNVEITEEKFKIV